MQNDMLRFLGLMRRAGKLSVGETGTGKSVRAGQARLILLASDASGNAQDRAEGFASRANVPLYRLHAEKAALAADYAALAREAAAVCRAHGVPLVVHTHADVARELGCCYLHMTLAALEAFSQDERERLAGEFELSTSCHSVEDARRAVELGCARILAGHVYETDCKPGLEPRGLRFLCDVCAAVDIPVWAIGGVTPKRLSELRAAGAAGACMMSAFMRA